MTALMPRAPRRAFRIAAAAAIVPAADGVLTDAHLHAERRSRKVGPLPLKARMTLAAAERLRAALGDADRATPAGRIGVSFGTLFGAIDVAEQCVGTVRAEGFEQVTPSWYAAGLPNATAAIVASLFDWRGPNLTFLGYQAGLDAIVGACRQLAAGHADAVCAGGFDLPSARYVARADAPLRDAQALHPGAGVVWLAAGAARAGDLGRIVGWSQQAFDADAFDAAHARGFPAFVAAALPGAPADTAPAVHVVRPGAPGTIDRLAASAPIALAEGLAGAWRPGLHALVVKGLGALATCVIVDNQPVRE
ncbi:beta-ketoacyl synthase N-terminal-like domain-containing protein [Burkholderia ubonensis]|uniref:beta-ketoacyl synthase N-terminal-like domain-containing protein n=1 Tax=Burkholderia ubonensis TaxID=101571 RepID=UPI0009B3D68D|nr:beta-ketoacyl synthase N-terminal-like domain-containing protein [Burkholderia ubonensis]